MQKLDRDRIGNDLVDLQEPQSLNHHSNPRFLSRICSLEERECILASDDPHLMLWTHWAIKEASYKAIKKAFPHARFLPLHFSCTMLSDFSKWESRYQEFKCMVTVASTDEYVHAIAIAEGSKGSKKSYKSRVKKIASEETASLEVRKLALKLLEEAGYPSCEIVRPVIEEELSPPIALLNGQPLADCDISLSHDGKFIAAAVLLG